MVSRKGFNGGQNKKSAAVRRAEGHRGHRPIPPDPVPPPPKEMPVPAHLSEAEAKVWKEIAPRYSYADPLMVEQYCRLAVYERKLSQTAMNGTTSLRDWRQIASMLRAIHAELTRIGTPGQPAKEPAPMDEFLDLVGQGDDEKWATKTKRKNGNGHATH